MFLDNEHRLYSYHRNTILITGLTNTYTYQLTVREMQQFLSSAPAADLKILLVHKPSEEVVRLAMEQGYALVFAGHTHGGHIVLHPLGIPWRPVELETPYYSEYTKAVERSSLSCEALVRRWHQCGTARRQK